MSKLGTVWRMLTVTTNPLTVLSLKTTQAPKSVTFKNSKLTYCLTYAQFRVFRDNYSYLTKYKITQIGEDEFRVANENSQVTSKSHLLPLMFDLMQEFALNQENGLFHLKSCKLELWGSLAMLDCFQELRRGDYETDFRDEVVLDVGGFEGESAAYFWAKGAKKVIIYEPVPAHIGLIQKNVALNQMNAEIHLSGIGNHNGTQKISYCETDPGFGVLGKGPNNIEIIVTDISKVISESGAEIGKFDCEGAEQYLATVPVEILRKISYYIVEVHSPEIRTHVLEKFRQAGFTLEKEKSKTMQYSVLTLRRVKE